MLEDKVDQSDRWVCRLENSSILSGSVAQVQARGTKHVSILAQCEILVGNDAGAGSVVASDVVVDVQSAYGTDASNGHSRGFEPTVCIQSSIARDPNCQISKTSHASTANANRARGQRSDGRGLEVRDLVICQSDVIWIQAATAPRPRSSKCRSVGHLDPLGSCR